MLDSMVAMRLTTPTNCGWDCSKLCTEDSSPKMECLSDLGFFSSRVASWAETPANPAMLWACS
jgi:hypothetical protein